MSFKSSDEDGSEVSLDLRFDTEEERDWFFNRFNELLHGYADVFQRVSAGTLAPRDINVELEKKVDRVQMPGSQSGGSARGSFSR